MNSREIATIIVFTALTIVSNPIRIPTLYWPGFFYRIWEIPIVVTFLLFGPKIGISVAAMNVVAQIALFPVSAGYLAYPWGLVATLTMLLGVYLALRLLVQTSQEKPHSKRRAVVYVTALGLAFRAGIMPFVDYVVYLSLLPLALGQTFSEAYVLGLIPSIVIFNLTVPLYTIPIAYLIARKVGTGLQIGNKL